MKCYELTPAGLVDGLPITIGNTQPNRVRLGEGAFLKTSKRLGNTVAYAIIDAILMMRRDGDRVDNCDLIFGDKLELFPHEGKSPEKSVLVLISHFSRQQVSFVTEGDCEVLTEAVEKEHNTQAVGRTALVRLGPGGLIRVAEGVISSTDPRFVHRICLDADKRPIYDKLPVSA